jgi:hypothetical protein
MPDTYFAPARRTGDDELRRQQALIASEPLLETVSDSISVRFLIVNDQRQIVFGNVPETWAGKRHGEAFHCIYAFDGPGGCGTSKACSSCGAAQAVAESIRERRQVVRECRMVVEPLEGCDFEVTAAPFEIADERFTLVFFEPLGRQKPEEVAKAEQSQLNPLFVEVAVREIFDSLRAGVQAPFTIEETSAIITVDPKVLVYALASLIEFGADAGAVKVWYEESRDHRTFVVDSLRRIPERSVARLFDSGKPYIAKLMGQRVLGGRVWMTANADGGARFHLGFGIASPVDTRH